jgi:hypothetical protein
MIEEGDWTDPVRNRPHLADPVQAPAAFQWLSRGARPDARGLLLTALDRAGIARRMPDARSPVRHALVLRRIDPDHAA